MIQERNMTVVIDGEVIGHKFNRESAGKRVVRRDIRCMNGVNFIRYEGMIIEVRYIDGTYVAVSKIR